MNKLCDLPNQQGYRFIGIKGDFSEVNCYVDKDPETGCHYVNGGAKYCELIGWIKDNATEE